MTSRDISGGRAEIGPSLGGYSSPGPGRLRSRCELTSRVARCDLPRSPARGGAMGRRAGVREIAGDCARFFAETRRARHRDVCARQRKCILHRGTDRAFTLRCFICRADMAWTLPKGRRVTRCVHNLSPGPDLSWALFVISPVFDIFSPRLKADVLHSYAVTGAADVADHIF